MTHHPITAVILAGGRGTRMGGADKGLLDVAGRPLLAYVLEALAPQVDALIVNANRNTGRYAAWGYPVIADAGASFDGPLAGIAAALAVCTTPLLLTAPCDCPRPAPDLAVRLRDALMDAGAELAVAHDGRRLQPGFALLHRELLPALRLFLAGGERRLQRWCTSRHLVRVDFSDRPDSFLNLNSPDDRAAFEAALASGRSTPALQEPQCPSATTP